MPDNALAPNWKRITDILSAQALERVKKGREWNTEEEGGDAVAEIEERVTQLRFIQWDDVLAFRDQFGTSEEVMLRLGKRVFNKTPRTLRRWANAAIVPACLRKEDMPTKVYEHCGSNMFEQYYYAPLGRKLAALNILAHIIHTGRTDADYWAAVQDTKAGAPAKTFTGSARELVTWIRETLPGGKWRGTFRQIREED
jgi:hypothetical protein